MGLYFGVWWPIIPGMILAIGVGALDFPSNVGKMKTLYRGW